MRISHWITSAVLLCSAQWSSAYELRARDNSAAMGAARVTWRSSVPGSRRVEGVELGYEYYQAGGNQALAAGYDQTVEGQTVVAPDVLRHQVWLQRVYLAYLHQFPIGRHVELEPSVGLGLDQVRWSAVSAATSMTLSPRVSVSPVVHVALTARWNFSDRFGLEGRAGFSQRMPFRLGVGAELGLVMRASQNVAVRLGHFGRYQRVSQSGALLNSAPPPDDLNVAMRGIGAVAKIDF